MKKLFKRYLDTDITRNWSWQKTTTRMACARLDELIRFRGGIVHRREQKKVPVKRKDVEDACNLVLRLAEKVDEHIGLPESYGSP